MTFQWHFLLFQVFWIHPEKRGRFLEARHESFYGVIVASCAALHSGIIDHFASLHIHPITLLQIFTSCGQSFILTRHPWTNLITASLDWNKNDFFLLHVVQHNQMKSPCHFTSCLPHTSKVMKNLNTKGITNHQFLLVNDPLEIIWFTVINFVETSHLLFFYYESKWH